MDSFRRYGIYVIPEGAVFEMGSHWLGWNCASSAQVRQPDVADLPQSVEDLTATPRKYGFHGTIKPPFYLAAGTDAAGLDTAARAFCATRTPVTIPMLKVRRLGDFVAITPTAPSTALADLAAACVVALDPFRAPASKDELARRRKSGLTDRQEALLRQWGYPYVMEAFRFHMTLTGRTPHADTVRATLAALFAPVLPTPLIIDSLCMMGEDANGMFHLIHRYPLSG
jgi:putative phosphonate metabolism protein